MRLLIPEWQTNNGCLLDLPERCQLTCDKDMEGLVRSTVAKRSPEKPGPLLRHRPKKPVSQLPDSPAPRLPFFPDLLCKEWKAGDLTIEGFGLSFFPGLG